MSVWAVIRHALGGAEPASRAAAARLAHGRINVVEVAAVDGGTIAEVDVATMVASVPGEAANPDQAIPAEALLAQLEGHALGPPAPGLGWSDPLHRDVQVRAATVLARIESQPDRLPRRPQLLPALMRATGNGEASSAAIAALVQQDPTLTGNVLRIANSAYYRVPGKPLESVDRAIVRLGSEGMRRIVAASLLQPVMDSERGAFSGYSTVIWEHSLAAAAAAAAYTHDNDGSLASSAHMAALVRGLGSIVVVHATRDAYARHPSLVPDPAVAAALLDRAGATAARIATSWGLPTETVDALSTPLPEASRLGNALHLGRQLAAIGLLRRVGAIDASTAAATLASLAKPAGPAPWSALIVAVASGLNRE